MTWSLWWRALLCSEATLFDNLPLRLVRIAGHRSFLNILTKFAPTAQTYLTICPELRCHKIFDRELPLNSFFFNRSTPRVLSQHAPTFGFESIPMDSGFTPGSDAILKLITSTICTVDASITGTEGSRLHVSSSASLATHHAPILRSPRSSCAKQ